ncbi:MAG: hypothetical protein KIT35_05150 [Piscinibacter sp.]|uniref:outer membrane beta-barrel protein n=1 Tax=Piscinibacter TaxID=1114981 RepID=UPI000FDCF0BA|nr:MULTISPECIES: outer membrane beta-barrel protein [Piscinibacter]MCW5663198.1 hypothetical protein [Piscinibacter sp.]
MSGPRPSRVSGLLAAGALAVGLLAAAPVRAEDEAPRIERVRITEPYIEMRTGPGRGYPIHHVAARDEWIVIQLRFTDWFKVRTENGREGWVQRRQLESTMTEAGVAKSFRDVLLDDYLRRKVELGAGWGRFESEPMLKVWLGYRFADTLGAELTVGQVQGKFSGSDFWHLNLQAEPWSDQRISPFFAIGFGKFKNIPNASLVDATPTDAKLANASLGVRYYLTERFMLRADYSIYTAFVSDTRSTEYRAIAAGLSFFF